jgi:hypothetical protein
MCDPATSFNDSPTYSKWPMPLLRWMCSGTSNMLSVYSRMGGSVWLMGGGVAYNTLKPFNVTSNDLDAAHPVYSSAAGELAPSRLMYDLPHWQKEITVSGPSRALVNYGFRGAWPGAPDYSKLPPTLSARTDPVPPERIATTFYVTSFTGELMSLPTRIVENVSMNPEQDSLASTLDTLYYGYGGSLAPTNWPIMTYYHGRESGPVLFSGFPLWYFQRAQAIRVGDFVLQDCWHLTRAPLAR